MTGVLDIETAGDPWTGKLLCVGWRGHAYTLEELYASALGREVMTELSNPNIAKVTWTKYDHRWLRLCGIAVNGPMHDAQVKAWLLDEAQPLDLEACALRYLGLTMDKRIRERGGKLLFQCDDGTLVPLADAPIEEVRAYCERDLDATAQLDRRLDALLRAEGRYDHWLNEQEPFTRTLAAMEARGVPVDMGRSEALRIELTEEVAKLDAELHADADLPDAFNLGSTQQLATYLYCKTFALPARVDVPAVVRDLPKADRLDAMQRRAPRRFVVERVGRLYAHGHYALAGRGLRPRVFTDSGQASTAAPKLRTYYGNDPWVVKLLELKQRSTIVGTFLSNFRDRAVNERGEKYDQALRRVRDELRADTNQEVVSLQAMGAESVLLAQMREARAGSGEPVRRIARLSSADTAGAGSNPGAPPRHGAEAGPTVATDRARPPSEPRQAGQPARESGRDDAERTREVSRLGTFRLFGTLKQTGTDTGRLSSSEPNMQNIPARTDLGRRVRELFRPASGVFVHGDYSQLEPRLMAHWSQDPILLDVFRTDKDLYRITAAYIFGVAYEDVSDHQRGLCKTLVLALGYGAGARKVAMILTEASYPTTEGEAAEYLKALKGVYRVFFAWKADVVRTAEAVGYATTLAGRHRRLAAMAGEVDSWKATPVMHAVNSVIQGSAADVVQRVMVRADREFPALGLLAQVHDELLWEAAEPPSQLTLYKLRQVAERGHDFTLSVPLVFVPKIVESWAEGK